MAASETKKIVDSLIGQGFKVEEGDEPGELVLVPPADEHPPSVKAAAK